MSTKKSLAKIVRIISIPPIVSSSLLAILFVKTKNIFTDICDFVVSVFCVGILPLLSYFFHSIIPILRKTGRDGQRKLAFVFSGIGYIVFNLYSNLKSSCTLFLKQISTTYLISFFILVLFNKFLRFKMSGHAASISAPIIFLVYHLGALSCIPCSILFLLVFWASIKTKRHNVFQFLFGGICSFVSFLLSCYLRYKAMSSF